MKKKLIIALLLATVIVLPLSIKTVYSKMIRPSAVSGQFYPAEKEKLQNMVDGFLSKAHKAKLDGKLLGLISPHAGYVYSGQVAAYSYKLLEDQKYDVVIIMGNSHYLPYNYGSIYYKDSEENYFQTPLGDVKINKAITEELLKNQSIFKADTIPHVSEHSIEVQIPFLQRVLKPDFEIVPILFGTQSYAVLESAARIIAGAITNKNVLLIASTDLSHYYPYTKAKEMDKIAVGSITTLDPLALIDQIVKKKCELCGMSAVLVEMLVMERMGANKVVVLNMANSGDIPDGDKSRVVGYSAVAILKR